MTCERAPARMTILIADDHPLFRAGLRYELAQREALVYDASDGAAAVSLCQKVQPDLAVLDAKMPGVDGITACSRIVAEGTASVVVILTTYADAAMTSEARRAGARGLLSKECDADEILRIGRRLLETTDAEHFSAPEPPGLTERERQVLELLVDGRTRREMAGHLGISPETVKQYTESLFAKLEAPGRVRAVTKAIAWGLVRVPPNGGTGRE